MAVRTAGTHPRPLVFGDVIQGNYMVLMFVGILGHTARCIILEGLYARTGLLYQILDSDLSAYELLT